MPFEVTITLTTGDERHDESHLLKCADDSCLLDCEKEWLETGLKLNEYGRANLSGGVKPAGKRHAKVTLLAHVTKGGKAFCCSETSWFDLPDEALKEVKARLADVLTHGTMSQFKK